MSSATSIRRPHATVAACALATLAFASVGYAASADGRRVAGDAPATAATARLQELAARTAAPFPGFVLDRGRYVTVDVPGARTEGIVTGIDDAGRTVGAFDRDVDRSFHGFLRDRRGRFATLDVPGARGTAASEINDRGQVVGFYSDVSADPGRNDARSRAFLLDRGRFTRLDFPGARRTLALGIDGRGRVVGTYETPDGTGHGYVWERGRFRTVDVPGADATAVFGMNDRGDVVGWQAVGQTVTGFLLRDGRRTTISAPGAVYTLPAAINDRGQIAGTVYLDAAQTSGRGFLLADGASGPFTPVAVPGSRLTVVFGIDNRRRIVGGYSRPGTAVTP